MYSKMINNTSKGLLKKLFSKDRISGLAITEDGFAVVMEKSAAVEMPFTNLQAVKVNFYFSQTAPYRTMTLVTKDGTEYALNIAPHSGEVEEALRHFAAFQLKGDIPARVEEIDVSLIKLANGYEIKLQNGNIIVIKNGEMTAYPWNHLEYYRIDKPSSNVNLKFQEKKLFISISGIHASNLWLLLEILTRFGKRQ